jgi:hypothetical protein
MCSHHRGWAYAQHRSLRLLQLHPFSPAALYATADALSAGAAGAVRELCERQPACADVVRNALGLGVVVAALAAEPAGPGPAWRGECSGAFLHRLCERLFQSCAHEHHVAKLRAGAHACGSARPTLSHA